MQEQINQLQKQIINLEQKLNSFSIGNTGIDFKEFVRNEVVKDATKDVYEQSITINSTPVVLTGIPALATGIVIIKWKDKEYKVPYHV